MTGNAKGKRNRPAAAVTAQVDAAITEFGWAVVMGSDKDGFAYTVGLTETRLQAELCVHGVTDAALAVRLLDQLARRVVEGYVPTFSTRIGGVLRGLDLTLLAADPRARERARYAEARYGAAVSLVQCVLPDATNRFPWQYGVDGWQIFGQHVMSPWPKDDTPEDELPMLQQLLAR